MKTIIRTTLAFAMSVSLLTPISALAAARDQIEPTQTVEVKRIYLVKNINGFLIALKESELDAAPKLTLLGSARTVKYRGKLIDVEMTLVISGEHISTIDRYAPSGNQDSEDI